jgi:glycosyltransferase involved in cell wall biosynthesis
LQERAFDDNFSPCERLPALRSIFTFHTRVIAEGALSLRVHATHYCYFIGTRADQQASVQHYNALAQELVNRGHRVFLILESRRVPVGENPYTNPATLIWPSRWPTKPVDVRFLHTLIRQQRPDCLIANFGPTNLMITLGGLLRVPHRVVWHSTVSAAVWNDSPHAHWKTQYLIWRKKLVYRFATQVIANSAAAAEDAQRVYGVPARKCHIFYNALTDPLPHLSQRHPDSPHRLICVGRLAPSKGQDTLIQAVALLKDAVPELSVEFVGDGPRKAAYQRLAEELGVADRCAFIGYVSHDEVLARMATASVCVLPSRSEAFGLVNIEAMAVGTPVVASNIGGIPEIIRDGQDGFLVPPDDPQALADKLRLILSDPALRAEMVQNARQRFLDCFELKANVARQADWFEALVASSKT